MTGTLYLVATPIGNPEDITLRALRVLSEVDTVVCEERRVGSSLLAHYKIEKPLVELNERTETAETPALVEQLGRGQTLALISDHGTSLVADAGGTLVAQALQAGIRVEPVPGASSVVAALVASGLPGARFRFLGTLSSRTEVQRRALRDLRDVRETLVLLDAPNRLSLLLTSVKAEFGEAREVAVACELTRPDERIVRGSVGDVIKEFKRHPFKGEFVLIVSGARMRRQEHGKSSSNLDEEHQT